MELLGAFVGCQRHGASGDAAVCAGDAVGIASDDRAQIAAVVLIAADAIVAQHHVHHLAVSIRDLQPPQRSSIGQHLRLQAAAAQGIQVHGPSIPGGTEGFFQNCHRVSSFSVRPRGAVVTSLVYCFFLGKTRGLYRFSFREGWRNFPAVYFSGRESSSSTHSCTSTTRNWPGPVRVTTFFRPALIIMRRHMAQDWAS